jgi:hypothetical protein
MPKRMYAWLIILFWLASTTWFFCREFLPEFQAGLPPVLVNPEYSDDVRPSWARWLVYRDRKPLGDPVRFGDRIGSGETQLRRKRDRTLELSGRFSFTGLRVLIAQITTYSETFRIGLKGNLRSFQTRFTLASDQLGSIDVLVKGRVQDGWLTPSIEFPSLPRAQQLALNQLLHGLLRVERVKVPARGSFLNPMHPLEKVAPGLYPGQRWRMPLMPGMDLFGQRRRFLDAEVTEATLRLDGARYPCLVINYREGRRLTARTWVRQSDRTILRQEAHSAVDRTRLVLDQQIPNR